jgi:heat shock protein HslJ
MKRLAATFLSLIVCGLVGGLAACNGANGASQDLAGTEWRLVSLRGEDLIEDTSITLYFKDGYLGGTMTCNNYGGGPDSGGYAEGRRGRLSIPGPFAVTVQLCETPEGVMAQEEAYIEALLEAAAYRVEDERLTILNESGEAILMYAYVGPVTVWLDEILADPLAYEDQPVRVRGYGAVMVEIALCPGYVGLDQRTTFWGNGDASIVAIIRGDLDLYHTDDLRTFEGTIRVFRGEIGCPNELKEETIPYFEMLAVVE